MVSTELNKLLDKNKVDKDFKQEVRDGYRLPLQETINKLFTNSPNYRYGGSLAKGTANINSCDIDLLCYMDADCEYSVEEIYNNIANSLKDSIYTYSCKNSAICVSGDSEEGKWDITVDIVPGKYTSNEENKDVYLWCHRDEKRLKSNPEKQISKVQESDMRDVVRIIKLYRESHGFKFKSFFLEIFAIDVVENEIRKDDTVYDKLVKFCSHYAEIGKTKIYDPANTNNDIMQIHSENEFATIRKKIREFYEVLLTNNEELIIDFINGKTFNQNDIEQAYEKDAKAHSSELEPNNIGNNIIITCKNQNGNSVHSKVPVPKHINITFSVSLIPFSIFHPSSSYTDSISLIISNAGYEALKNNCQRGRAEELKHTSDNCWERTETTLYYGNHFVQAVIKTTSGVKYFSKPFIVAIR